MLSEEIRFVGGSLGSTESRKEFLDNGGNLTIQVEKDGVPCYERYQMKRAGYLMMVKYIETITIKATLKPMPKPEVKEVELPKTEPVEKPVKKTYKKKVK